jgi:aspartate-semialdehyde dehydrogenase
VPVYRSHAESVNVEFDGEVTEAEARKAFEAFPGLVVNDNPDEMEYPMPLFTSGKDDVEVGRIRKDYSVDHGLNFWLCGDQIRKGAALNALQIAEYMIKNDML